MALEFRFQLPVSLLHRGHTVGLAHGFEQARVLFLASGSGGFQLGEQVGGQRGVLALGLGLVSQLAGLVAINFALGHLRAAPVSVCLLAQVVVTALVAMPLLGEYLKSNQIIGGVLVLGGIYLVTQSSLNKQVPAAD